MGKILLHEESEATVSDSFLKDTRANAWPQFTVRIVGHWTDMTKGTRDESCKILHSAKDLGRGHCK